MRALQQLSVISPLKLPFKEANKMEKDTSVQSPLHEDAILFLVIRAYVARVSTHPKHPPVLDRLSQPPVHPCLRLEPRDDLFRMHALKRPCRRRRVRPLQRLRRNLGREPVPVPALREEPRLPDERLPVTRIHDEGNGLALAFRTPDERRERDLLHLDTLLAERDELEERVCLRLQPRAWREAHTRAHAGRCGGPYDAVDRRGLVDDRGERRGDDVCLPSLRQHVDRFFGRNIPAWKLRGGYIDEGGEDPCAFGFLERHEIDRGAGAPGADGAADAEGIFGGHETGTALVAAVASGVIHFDLGHRRICDTYESSFLLEYDEDSHLGTVCEMREGRHRRAAVVGRFRGSGARVTMSRPW